MNMCVDKLKYYQLLVDSPIDTGLFPIIFNYLLVLKWKQYSVHCAQGQVGISSVLKCLMPQYKSTEADFFV